MKNIIKATSRGQITLPSKWRKSFNTDNFIIKEKKNSLEITPINLKELESDYTVFDAIRDNKGKGIKATDLINILEKIEKNG
jgi:bifunctional DNA-binding transcriptional regulator/antitoxin component of YhaV-PrlF toxin-antitoxin module